MPGVPSNKACERCKKKHIKCDETRPYCQRCAEAGVECPGYVQTRKFIDQGAAVRRRYAPYQENIPKPATARNQQRAEKPHPSSPRQNEGSEVESQGPSQPQSPQHQGNVSGSGGAFTGTSGWPSISMPRPAEDGPNGGSIGQMSDIAAVPYHLSQQRPSPRNYQPPAGLERTGTNQPPTAYEYRPQSSPHAAVQVSRTPSERGEREQFQDIFSELMTGTEHETCFLVRHFCENLVSWLDISDTGKFFAAYVPVRAIDDQSLRYAISALSAKHLARMKGVKSTATGGMFTSPATMETYPSTEQVDWSLKAANYYYLAVSHMNSSISDYAVVSTSDVLEPPISIVNRWLNLQRRERDQQTGAAADGAWKTTENLLASSTILTIYKFLDEPGEKWQSYLAGVKPLFAQLLSLTNQDDGQTPRFSAGVAAVFWNFARLDYLASYYNRLPTHIDPDDIPLWRAAGLSLDDQGNLTTPTNTYSKEDMATNVLTRLLNKLTNYLAAFKKSQLEQWTGRSEQSSSNESTTSSDSQPTIATWLKLTFEFQSWVERIPETFRPCLRLDKPKQIPTPESGNIPFPEIFYSIPSCAAAMQQYHFGRLALSLNRPADEALPSSTAFDRLQGYRELTKEVDYRCREICGIALGRPQSGARVQMITLLYAVGQCLEKSEERQVVIDLLRGIEADLGWSTGTQVQKLQK
ncbi:hypothetical protein BJY04DRAFT_71749 [Aspergillus karnatakaensis]|uniref:uncharacterized protein n=1 Tax=Aspergillus karnatakaensis TaxID=1810916 RepID=UPI003CCE4BC0